MNTSVLAQTNPGGSPFYATRAVTVTNSVSVTKNNPSFCGNYLFSITSVTGSGTTALSASDLSIHPSTGLISLYTSTSGTVGTHQVSVSIKLQSLTYFTPVSASFVIKIEPCIVTSLIISPLSP